MIALRGVALMAAALAVLSCSDKKEEKLPEPAGSTAPAVAAGGPSVVFLGDSLTAGLGLPADATMPALIQQKITADGRDLRVINAGRSGDTTAGGLARVDWYLRDEVNLAVMVIGLGSNDAMRGLPLEEIEANLAKIIARVRDARPGARILLFQMLTFPNMGADYAGAYEQIFPRVAKAEGITLLPFPLEGIAAVPELNQRDGVHPNAEGTAKMADRVWASLRPHLSR